MKIHLGSARTKRTRCGKTVARRWWVPRSSWLLGILGIKRRVDNTALVTCRACLKGAYR